MDDTAVIRLSQAVKKLGISSNTLVDFLKKRGFAIESNPNAKITQEQLSILEATFKNHAVEKEASKNIEIQISKITSEDLVKSSLPKPKPKKITEIPKLEGTTRLGTMDSDSFEKLIPKQNTSRILNKADEQKTSDSNKITKNKPQQITTKEFEITIEKSALAKETNVNKNVSTNGNIAKETKNENIIELSSDNQSSGSFLEQSIPEDIPISTDYHGETKSDIVVNKQYDNKIPDNIHNLKSEKITFENKNKLQGIKVVGKFDLNSSLFNSSADKEKSSLSLPTDKKEDNKTSKTSNNNSNLSAKSIQNADNYKTKKNTASYSKSEFKSKNIKSELPKEPRAVIDIQNKHIKENIKNTISQINQESGKSTLRSKLKKQKRIDQEQQNVKEAQEALEALKILKVNEFASANDLALMMNEPVNEIISTCMSLGVIVAINQRLDSDIISLIAEEFGYKAEFISALDERDEEPDLENMVPRPPIVTIMGHVDHGKTSLLDRIHNLNVTKKEAGGITQHIGAYDVSTKSGHKISFLDTPGHEAFTAMRSRGAKITDIVVIVVAADDGVMPQTKEAISHAQSSGVAIIIAINKIDKDGANQDRVKEQLASIGILVEEWGGKYQCQPVSAHTGEGIEDLLEKILLEAEVLDLKASNLGQAKGIVIESSIEKGKGYVSTVILQTGTLYTGDVVVAGSTFGKIKAIKDCRGKALKSATPACPIRVIGLESAPQSGDVLKVMPSEKEARALANTRQQLLREQAIRVQKHLSLDQIGKKLSLDESKELKVIIKCDFDGSVEALADSLLKLSNEKVKLVIVHKAVGAITESDVLLASATNAEIIGFNIRPIAGARLLANSERVDIQIYSVIYDAIEKIRATMEKMLPPSIKEEVVATASILEIFKISKVGKVAGCRVESGVLKKSNKVRVVRKDVVKYTGKINILKRFKDDVKEVKSGVECGLSLQGFSDFEAGDIIESFEEKQVASKL